MKWKDHKYYSEAGDYRVTYTGLVFKKKGKDWEIVEKAKDREEGKRRVYEVDLDL